MSSETVDEWIAEITIQTGATVLDSVYKFLARFVAARSAEGMAREAPRAGFAGRIDGCRSGLRDGGRRLAGRCNDGRAKSE